ncbi:MAG: hypothetical protein ACRETC_04765 [Gammaproteobacteria bacterium]
MARKKTQSTGKARKAGSTNGEKKDKSLESRIWDVACSIRDAKDGTNKPKVARLWSGDRYTLTGPVT